MGKFYHIDMDPALEAGIGDTVMHPVVADTDIRLPDGSVVPEGTMGGYVETEDNLAQDGSWIGPDVFVYDGASVTDGAYVENHPPAGSGFCQTELCGGTHVAGENIYHFTDADNESCIVSGADVGDPETGGSEILLFQGTEGDIFIAVDGRQGDGPEIARYTQDGMENPGMEDLGGMASASGSYADLGSLLAEMSPQGTDRADAGWQQLDVSFLKNDTAMGREARTFCVSESDFHRLPFLREFMDEDRYSDLMDNAKTSFEYTVGRDGNQKTLYSPMQLTYEPAYSLERTGRDGNTRTYDVAGILTLRTDMDGKNSSFFEDGEYSRRLLVTDNGKLIVDLDAGADTGEASNHILPVDFDSRDTPMFREEMDSFANLKIFGKDEEARERKEAAVDRGMISYREYLAEKAEPFAEVANRLAEQGTDNISDLHYSIDTLMGYRDFLYEEASELVKDNISGVKGELDAADYLITIADEYRANPKPENILHARPHTEAFRIMSDGRLEGRPAVAEELGRLDRGEISSLEEVPMGNTEFSEQSDAILLDYFHDTADRLYADRAASGNAGKNLSAYGGTKDGKPCIRWDDITEADRPGVYREVIGLLQDHRDAVHKETDPVSRISELKPDLDRINEKIEAVTASIEKNYGSVGEVSRSRLTAQMAGTSFSRDADMLRTGSQAEKDMAVRDIARTCVAAEWMPQEFNHAEPDMEGFDKEDFMSRADSRVNGGGPQKIFFDRDGTAWHGDGTKVLSNPVRNEREVIGSRIYNPEMDRVFDGQERPVEDIEKLRGDAVEKGPVKGEFPETSRHMTGIEGIDEYAAYSPENMRASDVASGLDRWLTDDERDRLRELGIGGTPVGGAADQEDTGRADTGTGQGEPEDAGARTDAPEPEGGPSASPGPQDRFSREDSYRHSTGPKARINENGKVEISEEKMEELTRDGKDGKIEELKAELEAVKSDILHYSGKYREFTEFLGNDMRNISQFTPAQIVKANLDAACYRYEKMGGMTGEGCFVEKTPTKLEIRQDFRDFQSSNYHFTAVYLKQSGIRDGVKAFEKGMYEKTDADGNRTGESARVYSSTSDGIVHKIGIMMMNSIPGKIVQGIELLKDPAGSVRDPLENENIRDRSGQADGEGPDKPDKPDNAPGGPGTDPEGPPVDNNPGSSGNTDVPEDGRADTPEADSADAPGEDRADAGEEDRADAAGEDRADAPGPEDTDAAPGSPLQGTEARPGEAEDGDPVEAQDGPADRVEVEEGSVSGEDTENAADTADAAATGDTQDGAGDPVSGDSAGDSGDPAGRTEASPGPGTDTESRDGSRADMDGGPGKTDTGLEAGKPGSQDGTGSAAGREDVPGKGATDNENRAREHAVDAAAGTAPEAYADAGGHGDDVSDVAAADSDGAASQADAGDSALYADRLQDIKDDLDRVFENGTDGEDMERLKEDIADGVADGSLSPEDLLDLISDASLDSEGNLSDEDASTAGTVGSIAADMLQEGGEGGPASDFISGLADSLFGEGSSAADGDSAQESFWDAAEDAIAGSHEDIPDDVYVAADAEDFSLEISEDMLAGLEAAENMDAADVTAMRDDVMDTMDGSAQDQALMEQGVSDSLIEELVSPSADALDMDSVADRASGYYDMAMDDMAADSKDGGLSADDDPVFLSYLENGDDYMDTSGADTSAADYDAYLQSLEGTDTDYSVPDTEPEWDDPYDSYYADSTDDDYWARWGSAADDPDDWYNDFSND